MRRIFDSVHVHANEVNKHAFDLYYFGLVSVGEARTSGAACLLTRVCRRYEHEQHIGCAVSAVALHACAFNAA